jgi:hypothetical protein
MCYRPHNRINHNRAVWQSLSEDYAVEGSFANEHADRLLGEGFSLHAYFLARYNTVACHLFMALETILTLTSITNCCNISNPGTLGEFVYSMTPDNLTSPQFGPHQLALPTPGRLPSKACILKLYCEISSVKMSLAIPQGEYTHS